ncbi:MAG: hypothetical protein GXX94_11470 [Chloroflexi bacterium]|nr:hypothetical protein [Chloroflexota bacterium]
MRDYRPKCQLLAICLLLLSMGLAGCLSHTDATPQALTYNLPTTLSISRGMALPGTGIVYEAPADEGVYLTINGQRALKRIGDSVQWSGPLAAETEAKLDLRLVWTSAEKVDLAGTAEVVIRDAAPQSGTAITSSTVSFGGPVAYGVAQGSYIPGTTLTYVGETEQGAELGGLYNEFPYRQIGDSIVWEGSLRDGVYLRTELRTVQYDRNGLRLAGVATLWLGQ